MAAGLALTVCQCGCAVLEGVSDTQDGVYVHQTAG